MADHIPAWRTRILALRGVIRLAPVSQPKRPKRKVADPTAAGPRPLPASGRKPQSDESRWRIGARRLGTTFEAYRDHVQAGEKWCSRCKRWQPLGEFGPHKSRGTDTSCIESSRAAAREWSRANQDRIWRAKNSGVAS